MFFNLIVSKLKHLKTIWECRLCGLCFSEIIHNFLIWIGLFDIIVIEIYNSVTIWEYFSLYAIVKDHFFFTIFVNPLNLSIITYDLFNDFHIRRRFVMIISWEFHIEIFLFFIILRLKLFFLFFLLLFL